MIRRFETRDLDEVMSLWLHANIESHSFIEADYWKKNYRKEVVFYQHRGFKIINQETDENTSEEEYTMEWHR